MLGKGNSRGKTEEPSVAGAGCEKSRTVEVVRVVARIVTPSSSDLFLCLSGLGRRADHYPSFSFQLHRSTCQCV